MKQILHEIKAFRLGYAEERPYPWRWTTPIVLCAFFVLSPFLALVNIPLSAYNIVQEFTYQPNDTLPSVFLADIVPSVLQNPAESFTPQLLDVGYTIVLDNYIFNYTIAQAFDGADTSKTVSAFSYYNNPLSDSCDVTNITVQVLLTGDGVYGWASDVLVSGTAACYIPSLFYLTWGGFPFDPDVNSDEGMSIRSISSTMSLDFAEVFSTWSGPEAEDVTQGGISFTVHPCCDCAAVLAGGPLESSAILLQPPCSSRPPHFLVVDVPDTVGSSVPLVAGFPDPPPLQITELLAKADLGNISIFNLSTAFENLVQMFYHLVRVDLGVILDNQIYNSPEMFNRTISVGDSAYGANLARGSTSNTALMAQWQKEVEFFQNNTRVPPLEYLRSVPRLKPLGSAVTSVFVSSFAMLSVIWTVFSLAAGGLARAHGGQAPNDIRGKKHPLVRVRSGDAWLESGTNVPGGSQIILLGGRTESDAMERWRQRVDRNDMRTRVALARITAALKKHRLMEDDHEWVEDDNDTLITVE